MPRDRFLALMAFWHLNDNAYMPQPGEANYDKLYKSRPFYDALKDSFAAAYSPMQNLAVDESIMPFRGRVAWRQFIHNKPERYGMKMYALCESKSGYISTFKMYTGKVYGWGSL